MTPDSLAARLRQTFLDELQEQLVVLNSELLALEGERTEDTPADGERLASIFRVAHTLKGAARVAGVPLVETVCHRVESVLADVRAARRTFDADVFALLFATVDALADAGERLRAGQPLDHTPLAELAGAPELGWSPAVAEATARPNPLESAGRPAEEAAHTPHSHDDVVERRTETRSAATGGTLRVDASRLDQLLAAAGQLAVAVMRAGERAEPIASLAEDAERLAARWRRDSPALRLSIPSGAEGDPQRLLLDRVDGALRHIAIALRARSVEARGDSRALQRAADAVGEQVRGLRMRPFSEATEALPRLVRDLAAGTGKQAELIIAGGAVQADRAVLDGVREALLHLARNAVDHGLETPDERQRAGKPKQGTIRISAALRGEQLRVTVSDDGRGLDVKALRAQISRSGAEPPADERELVRMLFAGGLSTRREATAISGRGVGLDAARAAIERVRGTVDVRWTRGAGTVFHLYTPLTLATQRAVLARVAGQTVALPSLAVARLLRLGADQLRTADGRRYLPTSDGPVPIVSLARILGPPLAEPPSGDRLYVALLEVGERRLGVIVDALLDEAELVVRGIEHRGAGELPHLAGASLLPDGHIALVLNPAAVVHSGLGSRLSDAAASTSRPAEEESGPPRVLVVDDSITTRTLERSVMEAAGYAVTTAVDGEDAWRQLEEHGTDLVITDVEMPRMDGFALCERIRGSRRWAQLPVVIVTSLEAPEQRTRGLEAGADAYVVKSGFDQEALLQTVRDLLVRDDR